MAKKYLYFDEAERLYTIEFQSLDFIARKLGIAEKTVRNWKAHGNWEEKKRLNHQAERFSDSDSLKMQIAELSRKDQLSEAEAKTIERLTKAMERLNRIETRKAVADKRLRVKETRPSMSVVDALLQRALSEEYGLYEYQREFLSSPERFRAVLKSRQIGFSYVMALDALINCMRGLDSVIVSASQDQSDILIDYAFRHAEKLGLELLSASRSEIITATGKRILARPANFRTVQGFSGSLYLDEFAWVQDAERLWKVAVPVVVAVKGRITVCSTPYEKGNMFWRIMEGQDGRYEQFQRYIISIHEAIKQGLNIELEEIRGLFDAESFQRLFECQYFDDEESYFTFDEVSACAAPDCLNPATDSLLYAGYDVGRLTDTSELVMVECGVRDSQESGAGSQESGAGSQEAVITRYMKTLRRASFEEQRVFLREALKKFRVRSLHIDATGMGMNLAEDLQREFPHIVRPVWFTRELKEELAVNMKKLFEDRRIVIPNDQNLIAQVHGIKRTAKAQGFSYDSKRNAETGHADKFWALALACRELGFVKTRELIVKVF